MQITRKFKINENLRATWVLNCNFLIVLVVVVVITIITIIIIIIIYRALGRCSFLKNTTKN